MTIYRDYIMLDLWQIASFHAGTKQRLILLAARFSCASDVRLSLGSEPVSPYSLTGSGNRGSTSDSAIATRHETE